MMSSRTDRTGLAGGSLGRKGAPVARKSLSFLGVHLQEKR